HNDATRSVCSLSPLGERVGVRGLPTYRETVPPHPTPLPMGEGADRPCCIVITRSLGHDQSALMLAALTIGHHRSISALWKAPNASGVCWSADGISWPCSAKRCRTVASARVSTTAALSLAMTSFGVAFGTHSACQKPK